MREEVERDPGEVAHSVTAPTKFYIPSLDGVRTVAFAIVFAAHARDSSHGMFGVSLFFFLSGYLITTLLRREQAMQGRVSLRNFLIRRALRILPPMYLTLGFVVLLRAWHLVSQPLPFSSVVAGGLFFLNFWRLSHPAALLGPFWSLAVEEHFYLLFPLFFIALCRRRLPFRTQAVVLAGVAALVLLWRIALVAAHVPELQDHIYYGTDARLDGLVFGCIMALAFNPVLDRGMRPSRPIILLGGAGLLCSVALHNTLYRETLHYTLQGLALIPLFMCVIVYEKTWFRWLNVRWVRWIGTLTYSLYLVHEPMLAAAHAHIGSPALATAVALAGSLAYAWAMNRLVERPLISIRQHFTAKGLLLKRAPMASVAQG